MAPSDRLYFLDSLRGLAAIYVLAFHVFASPQPNMPLPPMAKQWLDFGHTGVTLFFVISAFSLSMTMPRHIASGAPILSFAISRFFRIVPLFHVLIAYQLTFNWLWLVTRRLLRPSSHR